MGYFERFLDTGFQRSSDGELIYYPLGVLSKGYIVPDAAKEQELRKKHKTTLLIFLIVSVLVNFIILCLYFLVIIKSLQFYAILIADTCLLMVCQLVIFKRGVNGLQPAARKFSVRQSYKKAAKITHPAVLWLMEIISLLFLLASIVLFPVLVWFFSTTSIPFDPPFIVVSLILVVVSIPVYALSAYIYAYMIKSRSGK